jgi:hypothetical protein
MEKEDKNMVGMAKNAFCVLMSSYNILMCLKAANRWHDFRRTQILLIMSCFIVGGVAYYKLFMSKEIYVLYYLQGASMWMCTFVLPALLSFIKEKEPGAELAYNLSVKVQMGMNVAFASMFIGAWQMKWPLQCTDERRVPWAFDMTFVLFIQFWVYLNFYRKQGFFITWSDKNSKARDLFNAQMD